MPLSLPIRYSCSIQEPPGSHHAWFVVLGVRHVDDLLDPWLDDDLGALVAGEEGHVDGAPLHWGAVLVHDSIHLGMADWEERKKDRFYEADRLNM